MKKPAAIFLIAATLLVVLGSFALLSAQGTKRERTVSGISSDAQIRLFEKRYDQLVKERKDLLRIRHRSMGLLEELGQTIEKLKADRNRGILGNVRLQRLLSQHLEMSRKVESFEIDLQRNQENIERLTEQLREAYARKMTQVVEAMTLEKDRGKTLALAREYFRHRERVKKYQSATRPETELAAFSIDLDPLDGPREINEKIDLLKDRVRKLKQVVKQIDREIERLRNEMSLAQEMRQMIEERNLFEDGVLFAPSPRVLPVRRPDDPGDGSGDPGASSDDGGYDAAGVHTSPPGGEATTGRASMINAINKEIQRLETERRILLNVIEGLEKKVKQFSKKAKEVGG